MDFLLVGLGPGMIMAYDMTWISESIKILSANHIKISPTNKNTIIDTYDIINLLFI